MRHLLLVAAAAAAVVAVPSAQTSGYDTLVGLFDEILESQRAPVVDGVSDYSPSAVATRRAALDDIGARLDRVDSGAWPPAQRVDHLLVLTRWRAADFEHRVLHPWTRDPGFYVDQVARIPFTRLPVEGRALEQLRARLAVVPAMLEAGRRNLTEGAGELTALAIRNLERADGVGHGHPRRATPPAGVIGWYDDLRAQAAAHHPGLVPDVERARAAVAGLRDWLAGSRARLNRPSGIGLEHYDYFQRYVRLMPYTAEDNLRLGERELERGRAFLAIERNRNRDLPPLEPAPTEQEYTRREVQMHANTFTVADAVKSMMDNVEFLDEDVARVDAEIYLRRPGYGSGYQMGKLQIDALLSDRYAQLGDRFNLREFHDRFLAAGNIPIALIRWEMTALDDQIRHLWVRQPDRRGID